MKTNTIKLNEAKLTQLVKEAVHDAIAGIAQEPEAQPQEKNLFWQIEPEIEKLLKSKFPTRQEHPDGPYIDELAKGNWRIWNADHSESLAIKLHMEF